MHLNSVNRLRGYWLAFVAWLVISVGIPMSALASSTEQGWMRLCTSTGVHWVHTDPGSDQPPLTCGCLAHALSPLVAAAAGSVRADSVQSSWLNTGADPTTVCVYHPRSPPHSR